MSYRIAILYKGLLCLDKLINFIFTISRGCKI